MSVDSDKKTKREKWTDQKRDGEWESAAERVATKYD